MPILNIEIVGALAASAPASLAQALADTAATVLQSRVGSTWVKVHRLDERDYAENGTTLAADELPVFVSILHREPPVGAEREQQVTALTLGIAQVLGRPQDRVHLEYLPGAVGRQSFGGRLVV